MSDEQEMTLTERFDNHIARALDAEESARTVSSGALEKYHMSRAKLHATLALAIAQRMTALATEDVARATYSGNGE